MSTLTDSIKTDLYRFFAIAFNAAPGVTYMNQLADAVQTGNMSVKEVVNVFTTKSEFTSVYPNFYTATQFANKMVDTVVGSSASDAAKTQAKADIVAALNSGMSRGDVVYNIFNNLAAKAADDADWGNTSKQMANKVAVAQYYTEELLADTTNLSTLRAVIANVTPTTNVSSSAALQSVIDGSNTVTGQTFTLTTGTDSVRGDVGNDTINGVLQLAAGAAAAGTTVQPGDVINGGNGTDALSISVAGNQGGAYTLSAVQTTGVEKVLFSNFDTDGTNGTGVDATLMDGVTTVGLSSSSAEGDTSVTGLKARVAAEMRNGAGDLSIAYGVSSITSGTADSQALTVSGVTAGTFTANGNETIAINTEVAASSLTNVASSTLAKVTVSGNQNLTVTGAITAAKVDATGFTGNLNIKSGAASQSIVGGSGADTIDMNGDITGTDTITGGDGVDTIKFTIGNNTVDGTAVTGELKSVSGFEKIDVASTNDAATLDLNAYPGITTVVAAANTRTVTLAGGDVGNGADEAVAFTLNGTAGATAVLDFAGTAAQDIDQVGAALATTIDAVSGFDATYDAATDTLSVTAVTGEVVDIAVTDGDATHVTFTENAYSDVTFSNLEAATVIDVYSADKMSARLKDASGTADSATVSLKTTSGDKGIDHTVGEINLANTETVNLASTGMTAGKTNTVTTLTIANAKSLNITGESNLTIGTITSAVTTPTLTSVDGSAATGDLNLTLSETKDQSIKTGSGNDTISVGTTLTAADTIDGGANTTVAATGLAGKDVLNATITGLTGTAGKFNIANVETINFTNTGTASIDAAGITGAAQIAVTGAAGTTTISNLASGAVVGLGFSDESGAAVTGTSTYVLADATGTADSLTVNLNEVTSNTIKTTGIETLNLAFNNTAAIGEATTTLALTGMTAGTIVATGAAADTATVLALGTLNAATKTVVASGFSGVLTVTASASDTSISVKTGAAANAIVGGAGNDTVTIGSLGADDADGAGGTDTLNATIKANLTEATANFETVNYTVFNGVQATVTGANGKGVDAATTFNLLGGDALTTFAIDYVSPASLTTINMAGYNGASTSSTFAASQLVNTISITGGAGNDTVIATTANNNAAVASMTGVENLTLNVAGGDSTFDFSKTSGLVKVSVDDDNTARSITLSKIADTTAVSITTGVTGTTVVIDSATKTAADNAINVTAGTTVGTVNLSVLDVETINLANKTGASTVDLSLVTTTAATGTVKLNVTGDQALTINDTSKYVTTIDASGMSFGGSVVQSARAGTTAATYTGSEGGDTFIMRNAGDVLNAAAGTDTLVIQHAASTNGFYVIDLTSTVDQVTTFNNTANAAVQKGFENVDLSGITGANAAGADITAVSTGSSIIGTAKADNITGGAGNDTITGGTGSETINVGSGTDTIILSGDSDTQTGVVASGFTVTGDVITGMGNGDNINLASLGNLTLANGAVSVGTTFAAAVANEVKIVSGSYNTVTGIFTSGAASATNNDYILQYNGGASTTTVNTVLMVDIVGTVTATAAAEVITLSVA